MGVNLAIHDISSAITLSNIRTEVKFYKARAKVYKNRRINSQIRFVNRNRTPQLKLHIIKYTKGTGKVRQTKIKFNCPGWH